MIIGFSRHGRSGQLKTVSSGVGPVGYLTDGMISAVGYVTGKSRRGLERNPPPVVLRGNPRITRELIDRVPFKRRYVSGVLSFSEESVTPEIEQKIMDRFEAVAFAGLAKDRYNCLWVRHAHTGRHEMHFVSPSIDLASGKNLNINPPRKSTRDTFDTLRRLINDDFHFSDPEDPSRARTVRAPAYLLKGSRTRENIRAEIASYLEAKCHAGLLRSREDVLHSLREGGYAIQRQGQDYVTIVDPTGKHCRLKGSFFNHDFTADTNSLSEFRLSPEARVQLEANLDQWVRGRAAFNQRRYGVPNIQSAADIEALPSSTPKTQEPSHDGTGTTFTQRFGALDEGIRRSRGAVAKAFERSHEAADRRRDAISEFDRTAQRARIASESLNQTTRRVAGNLSEIVDRLRSQALTAAIYRKYNVGLRGSDRDQEQALELQRERYASDF